MFPIMSGEDVRDIARWLVRRMTVCRRGACSAVRLPGTTDAVREEWAPMRVQPVHAFNLKSSSGMRRRVARDDPWPDHQLASARDR